MNILNWTSCERINIKSLTSESLSNINYINRYINAKYTGSVSNIASGIGYILIYKNNYPNNKVFWNIKHLLDYKPFPDNLKKYFDIKNSLSKEMNLIGLPTSFFINKKGDLIGYFQGDMEWDNDTVVEFINYLIKT